MYPFEFKTPRDYQTYMIEQASNVKPGETVCFRSPTGSGKSIVKLNVWLANPKVWIITPILELVPDLLRQLGVEPKSSREGYMKQAWNLRITSPVRFRNAIRKGKIKTADVDRLLIDEAHHSREDNVVFSNISAMIGDTTAIVGFTATDFGGDDDATESFKNTWDRIDVALTFQNAVDNGYLVFPVIQVLPIVDSDKLKLVRGEYDQEQAAHLLQDSIDKIVKQVFAPRYNGNQYEKPICWTVPANRKTAELITKYLNDHNLPAELIAEGVGNRQEIYERVRTCQSILVQMKVVGEGWDMPELGLLVDSQPTTSPVSWVQLFGRITRPFHGTTKEYICTSRNIEHHAAALGAPQLRKLAIAASVQAFGNVSTDTISEETGMPKAVIKTIKPQPLLLADHSTIFVYCLRSWQHDESKLRTYMSDLIGMHDYTNGKCTWLSRTSRYWYKPPAGKNTIEWGRWVQLDDIPNFNGYKSMTFSKQPTEKQISLFSSAAAEMGLAANDPTPTAINTFLALRNAHD